MTKSKCSRFHSTHQRQAEICRIVSGIHTAKIVPIRILRGWGIPHQTPPPNKRLTKDSCGNFDQSSKFSDRQRTASKANSTP